MSTSASIFWLRTNITVGLTRHVKNKYPAGRFRAINSDLGQTLINDEASGVKGYTAWYVTNGQPSQAILDSFKYTYGVKDAFKSFPSGHTCSAGTVYALIMIPTLFGYTGKKEKRAATVACWVVPIVYTALVAISRIMVGAHYMSDVTFGCTLAFVCMIISWEIFICKGSHFFALFPKLRKVKATDGVTESVESEEETFAFENLGGEELCVNAEADVNVANKSRSSEETAETVENSEDVQNFVKAEERGITVELFVRKNKDDKISKEFYYLGRMKATGNLKEFTIPKLSEDNKEEWKQVWFDVYEACLDALQLKVNRIYVVGRKEGYIIQASPNEVRVGVTIIKISDDHNSVAYARALEKIIYCYNKIKAEEAKLASSSPINVNHSTIKIDNPDKAITNVYKIDPEVKPVIEEKQPVIVPQPIIKPEVPENTVKSVRIAMPKPVVEKTKETVDTSEKHQVVVQKIPGNLSLDKSECETYRDQSLVIVTCMSVKNGDGIFRDNIEMLRNNIPNIEIGSFISGKSTNSDQAIKETTRMYI